MKSKTVKRSRTTLACHRLSLAALAMVIALPADAQKSVDGDSIEMGGKTYRLHGVDAPDVAQICADGWPAGHAAEQYLATLIAGKQLSCVPLGTERGGEIIAICRADEVDLGAAMVTGGYAYAEVPHSARYISQEAAAASALRGIHAHDCVTPWEWRARLGEER
ncbi:MAG: thermonuclease family protein [Reyranella sp.]|uniref:thermonuclease family protein n=1 Tax=Reyranella sp. TaxID=1929291 RepID=UPI003D114671